MLRLTKAIGAAAAAAALAFTAAAAVPAAAADRPDTTHVHYYLSLGDSLSVGDQPNAKGVDLPTNQGYADQLEKAFRRTDKNLVLYKLGCPGETSATLNDGGICAYKGDVRVSLNERKSSQLSAALAFLKAHRGQVSLITLDIGANDLNPCIALGTISKISACLPPVFTKMETHLAGTLAKLRAAAPHVLIVGMNYYDPELATWLTGTAGQAFAQASILLAQLFAGDLEGVYGNAKDPVADVFGQFDTTDMTLVNLPGFGKLPRDVALICKRTYECVPPPAVPDEHCNPVGYGAIATAYQAILNKVGFKP
jgi:lysophospholipase L1-like esterase